MIAAIEWIPAGRANPTPTKYEYSRAERDFLARVTAAQSGEGGGGDLAAPGGGGDAANNGPDAAGSDEEWEVMEQEGGGEGKTKLPKVDLASLPADLRMDEYSDDDDDEDKEKDVGGLLVGKDAEMMGDFQPNNAVEPNNGEGDHDDHDDDSDSEDEDDLADIPDTREYMPLDLKGLQSLGIGGQNYSVEDLQNMTLNNQHDLDNDLDDDEEEEDADAKKARRASVLKQKGAEWNELFADDINSDDDFKMGMSLTPNVVKTAGGKKKSKHAGGKNAAGAGASGVNVKLFAEFYRSDIIFASPLGLKMATTSNNPDGDGDDDEEADVDFLSSIDICLVARSDVLLMQNWDHLSVLSSLNQQPKKISDIDFSRVRNYFLNGQGANWRQLIVVSKFTDPYILSTFRRHSKNVEGQLRIRRKVPADDASICDVMVRVKQVFQRVTCGTVSEAAANRLRYFSDHVLPKLIRLNQKHTLIYIPSYFDFIAVRNLLLKREANFVSVTEYARVSEVSRGRARFLQGRKSIMLYTGRAHFFLRHKIKGARHIIFFGLPEYAEFYPAVIDMLNDGLSNMGDDGDEDVSRAPMSCLSLFTKFDAHQLERVVGTPHTERMIKSDKHSYLFCS
mmetsp:Transcript_28697/g.60591  ORF Transcript_28697/g.60591 Transcript_28697/m.60591 type:complete len:620 (-) Transcript_28697:536-2395(-)